MNKELRRKRLKLIFDGRCAQLDEVRSRGWPPTEKDNLDYGRIVTKYTDARRAWRAFRGWK